jgi:hypothetical protein
MLAGIEVGQDLVDLGFKTEKSRLCRKCRFYKSKGNFTIRQQMCDECSKQIRLKDTHKIEQRALKTGRTVGALVGRYFGFVYVKKPLLREPNDSIANCKYLCECRICSTQFIGSFSNLMSLRLVTCGSVACLKVSRGKNINQRTPVRRCPKCRLWRDRQELRGQGKCVDCRAMYQKSLTLLPAYVKETRGCSNPHCQWTGKLEPVAIDFHHKDKSLKLFQIGSWDRHVVGLERSEHKAVLINEIHKCITLCAVCHRLVEFAGLSVSDIPTVALTDVEIAQFNHLRAIGSLTLDNQYP